MKTKKLSFAPKIFKLLATITLLVLFASCSSLQKTKNQTSNEQSIKIQKDSLAELKIKEYESQIETLIVENNTLKNSLSKKDTKETSTDTEIKLKPEIDPLTGKFKESNYLETKDGKITKQISISGNGEVIVKTSEKSINQTEETHTNSKESLSSIKISEKEKNLQSQLKTAKTEISDLKSKSFLKSKTIESSRNLFWIGFICGILSLLIIYFGFRYLNNKFSILAQLKPLTNLFKQNT